eukprot:1211657-Prymnesium_polylepis.1
MPFCLLQSGKALKDRTNAVGDLKKTKYEVPSPTIMLQKGMFYSNGWVTLARTPLGGSEKKPTHAGHSPSSNT